MSRATTPGVTREDQLDIVQSIARLTYRINSAAQDLFLGVHDPAVHPPSLTSEQVIVGLAALQSAVSDLSRAYINHANSVLNRGSAVAVDALENILLPPAVAHAHDDAGDELETATTRAVSPGARSVAGTKRKRIHDPNAPKRALTAYFLYMKHERANIAAELGNARPKEVADEGTRRWSEMSENDRQKWKQMYAENLAKYKEQMSAYKASLPPGHKVDTTVVATPKAPKTPKTKAAKPRATKPKEPKEPKEAKAKEAKETKETKPTEDEHHDAAAAQLQLAVSEATEQSSSSDSDSDSSSSDSDDDDSANVTPTPSPPKPTPKSQKRRQSKAAAPTPVPAPVSMPPVIHTPTPAAKKTSPEKKKDKEKSKSKEKDKDRRASAAVTAPEPALEPPKSEKRPRKKRKSGVDE